jgi:hypothetical protein
MKTKLRAFASAVVCLWICVPPAAGAEPCSTTAGNPCAALPGGGTIATEVGECSFGVLACDGDATVCVGAIGPKLEVCNGLDDDCDGVVDNGFPLGAACDNGQTGACRTTGVIVCAANVMGVTCTAAPGVPSVESCNLVDDDCDGQTDENASCPNAQDACVVGQCVPSCSDATCAAGHHCGDTGNGRTCVDIDECGTNNGGCSTSPLVACTNTAGAFGCGPCPSGYTGDGRTCTPAPQQQLTIIGNLLAASGAGQGFAAKLHAASSALARGQTKSACNQLHALMNSLKAADSKKLTAQQTAAIIEAVERLRAELGC